MNTKEFFDRFEELTTDTNGEHYKRLTEFYHTPARFTEEIIDLLKKCINGDFSTQKEYYKIDLIGYTSRRQEVQNKKVGSLTPELWDLELAIEHENNPKGWCDEAIKLAYICCPLRVVIGYLPVKIRKNDMDYLNMVAGLFDSLPDYAKNNLSIGEYLIVLGNSDTKNKAKYFHYKAYMLQKSDNGKFKFIEFQNAL